MAAVLMFFGLLALTVPLSILRGFVLVRLWAWFLVPLGLPAIGIANAIGVSLVVSLLTHRKDNSPGEEGKPFAQPIAVMVDGVLVTLISWGVGAIVHGFM